MTRPEHAAAVRGFPAARIAPVLGLAAVAALFVWAFVVGGNAQIAAAAAEETEIAQENRRLCTGLGFDEQDGKYLRCTSGLTDIRRKQKERWDAASQ